MNYALNIFDAYGSVSRNLSETEIAKCSPEQTAVLFPLLEAFADTQAQDELALQVEANERKAKTALDRAEKVLQSVTPVHTAFMEWERTVARKPVPEPDPAVTKKVKAATKVRDAAQEYLAECVAELRPARALRDQKRIAFTDLLRAWSRVDGRAKNVGDLVKQRSETERKIAQANIDAGLPADYAVAQASTVGDSHLDRFKSGQGRGSSADRGFHLNRMRGAQLPPKLPAQR